MERQRINKLLGITKTGKIVYVYSLYSSGASVIYFDTISQDFINEQNDIETVKEQYGYLWQETVARKETECSLEEFMWGILADNRANGGYYLGHDDSYVHSIDDDDKKRIADALKLDPDDIVTFNFCGVGAVDFSTLDLKIIFDLDLYNQAFEHEARIREEAE